MHRIAVIPGDGIGPEITASTQEVIAASGVQIEWIEVAAGQCAKQHTGAELPWSSIEQLREARVVLKAPLIAERSSGGIVIDAPDGPHRHPSVNNGLRRELDLFVNVRPVRGWPGVSGTYSTLDLVIFREITEDMYIGVERQVDADTAEATKRISGRASRRIAKYACDYARRFGRSRVAAIHKANVLHLTDGLFLRSVRDVVEQHPDLVFEEQAIDAACYLLLKKAGAFDVMVLPNQYGDIISDLAAGLAGSLGLAPGANIGEHAAVFEAAHGAAPDIAGRGIANPIGLILSGALMLDHIGEGQAAASIRDAVSTVLAQPQDLTPDLGGNRSTADVTKAICKAIERA